MPHPRPVQRIELSFEKIAPRAVAAVLCLIVGAVLLARAFTSFVTPETGWQEIEASSSAETNCAGDFVLLYNAGAGNTAATAEVRALRTLYTDAAVRAYRMFDVTRHWDGTGNLYDVNHSPNHAVTVDPVLYEAFALLEERGCRALYLGPVYAMYQSLFFCQDDPSAEHFDPWADPAAAAFAEQCASFARDPDAVSLELLGENKVRLNVSQTYLDWAADNETESFLDFFWLRNAFIADYLADELAANSFTRGALSSRDGYVRCLDDSGASFSLNLTDRVGEDVYPAATVGYTGPMSVVSLRDYPLTGAESGRFYQYADGTRRTPFADLSDGRCRTALPALTGFSRQEGCAGTLLALLPLYVGADLSPEGLSALPESGVWPVWCQNFTIHSPWSELTFTNLYGNGEAAYTVESK